MNMNKTLKYTALTVFLLLIIGVTIISQKTQIDNSGIMVVNLNNSENPEQFNTIRQSFKERNPGYDMVYMSGTQVIQPHDQTQVVFVHAIGGVTNQEVQARATIIDPAGLQNESEVIVGDIIILQIGEQLRSNSNLGLLVFHVPQVPQQELPGFIRPDWDPQITDVPGGCATEIDAYRRILLTWRQEVGPYIYHALNAHRVRITDSFSHYHPIEHGFDEFYLVQMVKPGARLITSAKTETIIRPEEVTKSQVGGLIHQTELAVGDLVYIPRGVMHRGFGGVLAQVITVPGFIPGAEIGVDHHIRAINERLNLSENEALPYQVESSLVPVIR
jgi:hypothetical protein